MTFEIKTLNKIAPEGLDKFGRNYQISDEVENPSAIVVRSAKVATDEYSDLLAVARAGAGYNNISVDTATENGVCVFNTPGANANAVAELTMTMLGYAARNIGGGVSFVDTLSSEKSDEKVSELVEGNKSKFKGFELMGKSIGIIGLGKIGVMVANYSIAHGMIVNAYDLFPTPSNMHSLNSSVTLYNNLDDMLKEMDMVTVHVPLSDKTKNLISDKQLALMNDKSIVVNLSRGGIVDDDAVLKGIETGQVEKYITDFPKKVLLENNNVICIPHLGASTEESEANCAFMAVKQIKEYLEFGSITNSVNFPAIQAPTASATKSRIIVINKDVPNMIAHITSVFGEQNLNIQSFMNESNGQIGYNIVDLEVKCPDEVIQNIKKIENVIRVRLISL